MAQAEYDFPYHVSSITVELKLIVGVVTDQVDERWKCVAAGNGSYIDHL